MKKVMVGIALLCLVLATAGCNGGGGKKVFAPPPGLVTSKIVILNHRLEQEYIDWMEEWSNYVKGEIRNDNSQACTARIRADFFNYNDVVIAQSADWVGEMQPGETWRFSIGYWGERIKSYRVWVDGIL